jgi:hypothetical protein
LGSVAEYCENGNEILTPETTGNFETGYKNIAFSRPCSRKLIA